MRPRDRVEPPVGDTEERVGRPATTITSLLLAVRLIQRRPQALSQLRRVIIRPEMHVEEPRRVLETMVVQRRHVDAVLPQGPGDRFTSLSISTKSPMIAA